MRYIAATLLAASCALAGCSTPPGAVTKPAFFPGWPDAGTPPATMAAREVRLYRDEQGVMWDDTGKRHEPAP
jgi:hypothetical protein